MRRALAGLVLASALGCGGAEPNRAVVPLTDVPPNVMGVAKEKLPGVTFEKAWRQKDGTFEVSGKDKRGKVREIDVKPDGTVVEIE
jgi:hypothetical protein